jgi:YbbR domain-containing protein
MAYRNDYKGHRLRNRRSQFLLLISGLIVVCGLLFWLRSSPVEYNLSVPLKLENLPDNLIIVGQPLKEVEVTVRGRESILKTLLEEKHFCVLDLVHAEAGLSTLAVEESNLVIPKGISIVRINPTSITLRIEPKGIKTVPISITLTDSPAPGYKVSLTLSTPSSLQINGPEKTLERIDQLATQPISLKDVSESFKKEITLDLPEGVTSTTGSGTPLVLVQVNMEENIIVRQFANIPVESRNTAFQVKIAPPRIDIDVRGSEKTLESLSEANGIKVYVDLAGLAPGVYARRPQITLPVGITLIGAKPEVFTVTIGP